MYPVALYTEEEKGRQQRKKVRGGREEKEESESVGEQSTSCLVLWMLIPFV